MDTSKVTRRWARWSSDKNPNDSVWRGKSFNSSRWHLVARATNEYTECGLNLYSAELNTRPHFEPFVQGEEPPEYRPTEPGSPILVCQRCRKRANR
jgi:hypothetical protein